MKTNLEKYHKEVTDKYLSISSPLPKPEEEYLQNTMFQTSYVFRKTDKQAHKQMVKEGFSFKDLSDNEQAKIWSYVFLNTDYMSVGDLAIEHFKKYQKKKNYLIYSFWPHIKPWIKKIDNWGHGDMICSLYSKILEEKPDEIYPTIKKWANTKSPWKRRVAIVSLLYYYGCRKKILPYEKIISLVKPQLEIDHYYLQKAVGWTLRELTQAYPKETWGFLNKNAVILSATAYSAAVEKLPQAKRNKLKEMRKQFRKKGKI